MSPSPFRVVSAGEHYHVRMKQHAARGPHLCRFLAELRHASAGSVTHDYGARRRSAGNPGAIGLRGMLRRVSRLLAAGFLCIVMALVGCGGSGRLSGSEYKAKLAALNKEIGTAETRAQTAVTGARSVAQIRAALTQVAVVQDRVGDAVEKLKPPKNAEAANTLLARGAHDVASETRAVLPNLASLKTPRQALALLQRRLGSAPKGARELDQAVAELKKEGYSAGS